MDLYIDSGTHVDTGLSDRKEGIEDAIGRPQHIFVEGDKSPFSWDALKTLLLMSVFAPLVAIAAAFQIYIGIEFLGRLVSKVWPGNAGRDDELVELLKDEYDIDSQEVDLGISQFIFNHKFATTVANWTGVVLLYVVFWHESSHPVALEKLTASLLLSYVFLFGFLGLSNPFRNRSIANSIAEQKGEFDRACLVTGETHHLAVAELLKSEPGIDVINPVPESPSISTQFNTWMFKHLNLLQSYMEPYSRQVSNTSLYRGRWHLLALLLVLGLALATTPDYNLSQTGNLFFSTLASVQAAIFAIVFSIIILGVNLSATRYSPRLASTFRSDPLYRWTVAIFGSSIALDLIGIYVSNSITDSEFNILIVGSAALALVAFWSLYDFVNQTLEKTTPEGILAAINNNMTAPSIIGQAEASADDYRNHDPFLPLVSVIQSTVSEKDRVSANKGLDLLGDRVSNLVLSANEEDLEVGSPVDDSLQNVCIEQLPDIQEQAKGEGLDQISIKVTDVAEDIGEASVDRRLDSVVEYVVRGQTDLIDSIGLDARGERLREEIIDTCKEVLKGAADNQVWRGAAVGVRLLGWRSSASINRRSSKDNVDRRYTSVLILGFPKIVTTVVESEVEIKEPPRGDWVRVHMFEDEVEPGPLLIGSCYSSQAELTSAAIRYELRTEEQFLDWQSVASGWSTPVEKLYGAGIMSMARLWYSTILYLQFIKSNTPNYVMANFNPNVQFHLPDKFVISVIDEILNGELDPTPRIDFLPGWVDPIEMPLTGSKVPPIQDSDETFHEWLQQRRTVIGAGGGGFGATDTEGFDVEEDLNNE